MSMPRTAIPLQLALLLCTIVPAVANGEVLYKWIDEKGIVNYGSEPPRRFKAQELALETPTVSVIQSQSPATGTTRFDDRERELRQRIERLESDLEYERRGRLLAASSADAAELARWQQWRDICERERRVDCDLDGYGTRYSPGVVLAPFISFHHRRFHHHLNPLQPLRPVTVPSQRPLLERRAASKTGMTGASASPLR